MRRANRMVRGAKCRFLKIVAGAKVPGKNHANDLKGCQNPKFWLCVFVDNARRSQGLRAGACPEPRVARGLGRLPLAWAPLTGQTLGLGYPRSSKAPARIWLCVFVDNARRPQGLGAGACPEPRVARGLGRLPLAWAPLTGQTLRLGYPRSSTAKRHCWMVPGE